MKRSLSMTIGAAVAALGFTACTTSDEESIPDEDEVVSALELENGGLTMDDELPQFDDPVFAAADIENDVAETDALAADPATRTIFDAPGAVRHRVVILWGELPPDRTRDHVRDWTGRLSLSRGGMLVRRRIGFEEATDRVLPRTDRLAIDVQSITRPFSDGLVLEVADATPTSTDALVLTYNGAAGTQAFDLAALRDGPIVRDMGEDDRMVVIALRDGDPCDRGFMRGRWHQIRPGLGVTYGVVFDVDGAAIGHMRGIYGVRRTGEHVFFGKYIDRDGRFRGIYAGHYRDGDFRGRWLTRAGEHGKLQGMYRESVPGPRVGGGYIGRWAETSCAADLPADL